MCLRQKAASEGGKTGESPDETQCPDLHRGRSTRECPSSYSLPATPLPAMLPPFLCVLPLCLAIDFSAILSSDLPVVPSCLGTSRPDGHTAHGFCTTHLAKLSGTRLLNVISPPPTHHLTSRIYFPPLISVETTFRKAISERQVYLDFPAHTHAHGSAAVWAPERCPGTSLRPPVKVPHCPGLPRPRGSRSVFPRFYCIVCARFPSLYTYPQWPQQLSILWCFHP